MESMRITKWTRGEDRRGRVSSWDGEARPGTPSDAYVCMHPLTRDRMCAFVRKHVCKRLCFGQPVSQSFVSDSRFSGRTERLRDVKALKTSIPALSLSLHSGKPPNAKG